MSKNGSLIKSNKGYSYFLPDLINKEWTFDQEIYNLCIKATDKLAELRAYSNFVPDVNFFIQMHVAKESLDSSKIEGTKTTMDDLFLSYDLFNTEEKNEIEEVKNYIQALNYGIERMKELPLSSRLFKECHNILLQGVRGEHKTPGQFRKSQNWIGGATLTDAHYVPPADNHIGELMSDLEQFLHNNETPDLIKIALIHLQFEKIHPFLDGNGRIGRLIIILFLIENKILTHPVLYLSQFFENNRSLYYQNLEANNDENYTKWLKFFLVGVEQTSTKNLLTLQKIVELKSQSEKKIIGLNKKAKNAKIVLDRLYSNPIIQFQDIMELLKCTKTSANSLIKDLEELNILKEKSNLKRNKIYSFQNYLDLFENK
jgi:Fic family protein